MPTVQSLERCDVYKKPVIKLSRLQPMDMQQLLKTLEASPMTRGGLKQRLILLFQLLTLNSLTLTDCTWENFIFKQVILTDLEAPVLYKLKERLILIWMSHPGRREVFLDQEYFLINI